jgi:hypothetical protein
MPTPSLLIVPARFKTGKLYSQIPTSGAGDFTVTRNTAARRFDSAGLVASVASGIPRLDYYTSGGVTGCPALLVEPAATNLCLQSEAFNTTWTRVSGGTGLLPAITANAVVAPDGTTTADTVVFDRNAVSGSANFSQLEQVINFPTSGTYTFGVYAKATTSGDVGKQFYIRTRNTLVSGALTSSWVRYTSTETGLSSGNNTIYIGNRGGFTADQSVSVDLWGAQLETGSVATSYIPTTTGTGSRSADVISVSGAVSGCIGQTEGTLYVEVDVRVLGDGRFATLSDGTSNNRIQCRFNAAINGLDFLVRVSGSSADFSISNSSHPSFPATIPAGTYKIALGYKQNDYVVAMNGVTYTPTSATRNVPSNFSKVTLGADVSDLNQFNNRIRAAALYTTRLTNAELAALTA